jgi:hypothetical protein
MWRREHIGQAGLASLDLTGNRITDAGVQLLADSAALSTVRFIDLKLNPCSSMPLAACERAWTHAAAKLLPRLHTVATASPALPKQQAARSPGIVSSRPPRAAAAAVCQKRDNAASNMRFTSGGTSSSSSSSSVSHQPQQSAGSRTSSKRFKCNAVHPE